MAGLIYLCGITQKAGEKDDPAFRSKQIQGFCHFYPAVSGHVDVQHGQVGSVIRAFDRFDQLCSVGKQVDLRVEARRFFLYQLFGPF